MLFICESTQSEAFFLIPMQNKIKLLTYFVIILVTNRTGSDYDFDRSYGENWTIH